MTIMLNGDISGLGDQIIATTIVNGSVGYAKMQNVSATDKLLGRSSIGAGIIEEISCSSAGRDLLGAANLSAQKTLLGITGSIATFYQNQTIKSNIKVWSGQSTTNSSGVATFYPTDDNTGTGNAIFTNIYSAIPVAYTNTTSSTAVPNVGGKLIATDRKSITVNVVNGNIVSILGISSLVFSANGINVHMIIIGD